MNATPVDNLRGIALLVAAGIFLTINDGISKWLVPHYPVGQLLFLQAVLITLISAGVMRLRGDSPLAARSWRPHLYRGGLYIVGSFAFVLALRYLPFAEVVAIAFGAPLFMTLFGRLFLDEAVGWHRLCAVVAGFVGVLFVIRPGSDAMHWAVVLPLFVALADAFRDLVTRKMMGGESSLRVVFSTGFLLALAGLATLPGGWHTLRVEDIPWYGLSACAFVIAHFLMVEAFRHGQLVAVAPWHMTMYLDAIDWVSLPNTVGMSQYGDGGIVGTKPYCASGAYIAWREARLRPRRDIPKVESR